MSEFDKAKARSKGLATADKKPWNLCAHDGCDYRGTHSDSSGPHSYCGFHFYIRQGNDAIKAWKERDAAAVECEARIRARQPRYEKFGKAC